MAALFYSFPVVALAAFPGVSFAFLPSLRQILAPRGNRAPQVYHPTFTAVQLSSAEILCTLSRYFFDVAIVSVVARGRLCVIDVRCCLSLYVSSSTA